MLYCVVPSPVFGDLGAGTSRYWAHDRQVIILRLALDVKEVLLGGSLVPFIFLFASYSPMFLKT